LALSEKIDWPENIWMGVSIENEIIADRGLKLSRTQARTKFLSCEPLIGPLDLGARFWLSSMDWVIVGGESGPGARPMRLEWVRQIINDCNNAGVPVFVKQLGSVWAKESRARHHKGGDPEEWPEDLRVREFPVGVKS
jgi:protein gp37